MISKPISYYNNLKKECNKKGFAFENSYNQLIISKKKSISESGLYRLKEVEDKKRDERSYEFLINLKKKESSEIEKFVKENLFENTNSRLELIINDSLVSEEFEEIINYFKEKNFKITDDEEVKSKSGRRMFFDKDDKEKLLYSRNLSLHNNGITVTYNSRVYEIPKYSMRNEIVFGPSGSIPKKTVTGYDKEKKENIQIEIELNSNDYEEEINNFIKKLS